MRDFLEEKIAVSEQGSTSYAEGFSDEKRYRSASASEWAYFAYNKLDADSQHDRIEVYVWQAL